MAVMLGNLYKALVAGNVPADKAQAAAEEIAGYDNRLIKIEADLTLLKWMVGAVLALNVAMLARMMLA